jgi:hypothetical protein
VTIRDVEPLTAPDAAWMVVVPPAKAVANPDPSIMAAAELDELQVAVLVRFCVLLSLKVPVALNCCVPPTETDGYPGVTAIESRPGSMVRLAVPDLVASAVLVALTVTGLVPGTALGAV